MRLTYDGYTSDDMIARAKELLIADVEEHSTNSLNQVAAILIAMCTALTEAAESQPQSRLVQIGDYGIDPTKVISVGPLGGPNEMNQFMINVNMGSWVASYTLVSTTEWNPATVIQMINGAT